MNIFFVLWFTYNTKNITPGRPRNEVTIVTTYWYVSECCEVLESMYVM